MSDLTARGESGSPQDRSPLTAEGGGGWPGVSVVVPVRDEAAHLAGSVAAILGQDYPGELEVCLAIAPSSDGTEAIAAGLAAGDPRVSVVPNPSGRTPAGLNATIVATHGDVVVRVDAHARLSPGYITRAVDTMRRTGAANVGGLQIPHGTTPFERAVAVAMTSMFGTGGSRFHVGGAPGPVDTVYLGVFDRGRLEAIGGFDEDLVRNQDYELNVRLREAGGIVWFDPALRVSYQPRSTWRALARQYREYGWWKAVVLRRHPSSVRARQLAPVAVTLAVVGGLVTMPWRHTHVAALAPLGYAAMVAAASITADAPTAVRARLAAVYPTMHLSWGFGFLTSVATMVRERFAGAAPQAGDTAKAG